MDGIASSSKIVKFCVIVKYYRLTTGDDDHGNYLRRDSFPFNVYNNIHKKIKKTNDVNSKSLKNQFTSLNPLMVELFDRHCH